MLFSSSFAQKRKTSSKNRKTVEVTPVPHPDYRDMPLLDVFVIDSIVCDESDILASVKLPTTEGKLTVIKETIVYENEYSDLRISARKLSDGHEKLFRQHFVGLEWGDYEELKIDYDFEDVKNAYLMPDGQTLYFSAKDVNDDNKSFCLYTSNYNSADGTFMKPQKLPLPFLSESDDLLLVVSESSDIAWFATKRRQEQGKVCVYTLKLTNPWKYVDTTEMDEEKLSSIAELTHISRLLPSTDERDEMLKPLNANMGNDVVKNITNKAFIVNDNNVLYDASQLPNVTAKALYKRYFEIKENVEAKERSLDELRKLYHKSQKSMRSQLEAEILKMESDYENQNAMLQSLSNELRNLILK